MFFVLKNLLCSCLLLRFFFCFALISPPKNYLLALQYFVLFSNCFLLCLLSNNFDCSQIVFGWVCSPIFFLFSNILGWVCYPIFYYFQIFFGWVCYPIFFTVVKYFFGWVCSPIFFTVLRYFLAGSALQHFLLFLNIFWLSNIFHC